MDYVEKTVEKKYVYKGKILNLRVDDAMLPDGKECKREIIEHSGGACVLYVEEKKILFVRQYRYAYGESVLELPAGKLEPNEPPVYTAKRELEEEAGILADNFTLLFVVYPTPGYTNEKIYIYQAMDGKKTDRHLDEGEFLDVEWISLKEAKEMLQNGEIKDAKTIIALQSYFMQ